MPHRWLNDLALGSVLSVVPALAVLRLGVTGLPRTLLVFPLVLLIPGYALLAAVYPERWNAAGDAPAATHSMLSHDRPSAGLAPLERALLSPLVSTALVAMVALVLNFTPVGVRPGPILFAVCALSFVLYVTAFVRRVRISPDRRGGIAPLAALGRLRDQFAVTSPSLLSDDDPRPSSTGEAFANLLVVVAVLVVVASAGVAYGAHTAGDEFTEFYVVGQNADGEYTVGAVPTNFEAGQSSTLYPTVTNQEGESRSYTVVATFQRVESGEVTGTKEVARFERTVGDGETVRIEHEVTPPASDSDLRLVYLLYRGDAPADPTRENAYRSLRLWVSGGGQSAMTAPPSAGGT